MVRAALPFATHYGFIDRLRLADLYADSDLFVFPSPTETCGLVVLEAMASGLPVIATDCPTGPRELTLGGEAGVLVPVDAVDAVAAALRRLCGDGAERARLGAAARAAMEPFEARRVVAQWQRLLIDVVDEAEA